MNTITAIETAFNGVKYRSRNEARWGIFLSCLGIEFEYEPEGYEIKIGDETIRYLPDFFIPKSDRFCQDLYLEIKPSNTDVIISDYDEKKVVLFARYKPITILGSINDYIANITQSCGVDGGKYSYLWPSEEDQTDASGNKVYICGDCGYLFCECEHCGRFGFQFDGRSERIKCCARNNGHKVPNFNSKVIMKALEIARAHRFWK